ncbi:MAG: hypothetical protein WCG91_02215 [Candidatus Shapirobacteria bacterium]
MKKIVGCILIPFSFLFSLFFVVVTLDYELSYFKFKNLSFNWWCQDYSLEMLVCNIVLTIALVFLAYGCLYAIFKKTPS